MTKEIQLGLVMSEGNPRQEFLMECLLSGVYEPIKDIIDTANEEGYRFVVEKRGDKFLPMFVKKERLGFHGTMAQENPASANGAD